MNDISTLSSSHDGNWNYIAASPFPEIYQQKFISENLNTLHFERYNGMPDPDIHEFIKGEISIQSKREQYHNVFVEVKGKKLYRSQDNN